VRDAAWPLASRQNLGRVRGRWLHRQGWDLQLTKYGDGHWRATFCMTGQAHSIVGGSAWEPTPWRAVQRAAWEALET